MTCHFEQWCSACAAGTAIDGVHFDFPGGRVSLRRMQSQLIQDPQGRLVIDYPGGSVWFDSAILTHSKLAGGGRRLGINNWSTDYSVSIPDNFGDTVQSFEDEEDFDFGQMLVNIRNDEPRQKSLFS